MRPVEPPTCSDLPVSSSMWPRPFWPRNGSPPTPRSTHPPNAIRPPLARVPLHVGPLDLDPERLAVDVDVHPALERDRLVVLGCLEVLRHVRVEVVLPGEPAPLRDLAVEC